MLTAFVFASTGMDRALPAFQVQALSCDTAFAAVSCSYQVQQELHSFSVLDNLVAAGGQGDVLFWDRRTQKPLAAFDDMHMDDVTQVMPMPAVSPMRLSYPASSATLRCNAVPLACTGIDMC